MGKADHRSHGLGVSFDSRPNGKNFKARATFNGVLINLGRFKDAHSARLAYDQAVLAVRGPRARTNYPPGMYPLDNPLVERKVRVMLTPQHNGGIAAVAAAAGDDDDDDDDDGRGALGRGSASDDEHGGGSCSTHAQQQLWQPPRPPGAVAMQQQQQEAMAQAAAASVLQQRQAKAQQLLEQALAHAQLQAPAFASGVQLWHAAPARPWQQQQADASGMQPWQPGPLPALQQQRPDETQRQQAALACVQQLQRPAFQSAVQLWQPELSEAERQRQRQEKAQQLLQEALALAQVQALPQHSDPYAAAERRADNTTALAGAELLLAAGMSAASGDAAPACEAPSSDDAAVSDSAPPAAVSALTPPTADVAWAAAGDAANAGVMGRARSGEGIPQPQPLLSEQEWGAALLLMLTLWRRSCQGEQEQPQQQTRA